MNKSYDAVKEHISINLRKISGALPQEKIAEEIGKTKTVIETIGEKMFGKIISLDDFISLQEYEWERLSRELETHFNVKMEAGILIKGNEQQKRDTTWWTAVEKQNNKCYYWNRYRDYLARTLSPEVVKTIDIDTDVVMDNIENPNHVSFSRYGMVVGHVQSGKTGNYSGLICKAADAGYKFVVVIAGGINNLRDQTQERLNESFVGENKGIQVGAGKGNSQKELMPYSLTTVEKDFDKTYADRLAQSMNFDNNNVPILMVIKKNTRSLANVIDWLNKQYKNKIDKHALLIIDDESDYASVNTKEEEDPTTINKKIRILLSLFHKSAYVAYTATPYANIFIDHQAETLDEGRDLFPKDFIYALDAPSNYFGARKIFIDAPEKHLIPVGDHLSHFPMNHKSDFRMDSLPNLLKDAIRMFVINIGIRNLRGQGDKHNSMLIHATRFTSVHQHLGTLVEEYLRKIKTDLNAYGNLSDATSLSPLIQDIKQTFDERYEQLEFDWFQTLNAITSNINSVIVREAHQKTKVHLEYRDDIVTNAIVIGGSSLARGYTLIGLSISYFLRSTVFYDTLMQMGRWFGYRTGYEDLCRIYMPADRINDFADIITATEELFQDFESMRELGLTPNDFGLCIKENPNSLSQVAACKLQVTARNKQKHVRELIHTIRLDGTLKETSYLSSNASDIMKNLEAVKSLIAMLKNGEEFGGSYIWRSVNKEEVSKFLNSFKTFDKDSIGLSSRMPIAFIKQYVNEQDTDWDISLHNGEGDLIKFSGIEICKQKRKIKKESGYYTLQNRQVSSESAESIALKGLEGFDSIKKRGAVRAVMPRPLLMLHILQPEGDSMEDLNELAAFGVSFPGGASSRQHTVTIKINTVYYQNLLKELESENQSDD